MIENVYTYIENIPLIILDSPLEKLLRKFKFGFHR